MISAIRQRLDQAPMGQAQIIAVGLTALLSALDGYDVLSVTFAAPAITQTWGIGKAALGVVLSAGLGGMALGSFLLAPLADVFGRKTIVLASLVMMAAGMLSSAYSGSLEQLAIWRVLTGLGIGACISVINPLAAEFANERRRALTVSLMAMGYPVGGLVGGLLAAELLRHFTWPSIFVAGFVGTIVLIPVVALFLLESPSFLLTSKRADRLERLNRVLRRMGQPLAAAHETAPPTGRRGYAAVFTSGQRAATLWITVINVLSAMAFYYVISWLPQLVADAGFNASSASRVSATASGAGLIGGLSLGWLAQHLPLRFLASAMAFGVAAMTIAFGFAPSSLPLLLILGGACGFFLFGSAAGIYATLATTFGDEGRAAGVGFVIGAGRVSSAVAPLLAGALFASGLGRGSVSALFALFAATSASILLLGWTRFHRS